MICLLRRRLFPLPLISLPTAITVNINTTTIVPKTLVPDTNATDATRTTAFPVSSMSVPSTVSIQLNRIHKPETTTAIIIIIIRHASPVPLHVPLPVPLRPVTVVAGVTIVHVITTGGARLPHFASLSNTSPMPHAPAPTKRADGSICNPRLPPFTRLVVASHLRCALCSSGSGDVR